MRAFVAVKVPDGPSLSRPLKCLSAAGGLRVYGTGDLHITLSFVGEIGQERLREVSDAVERAVRGIGPFDITVGRMGSFPGKSGPRIVWAGAWSGGKLEMLAERVSAELDESGIGRDRKKFVPHITLARARDERGAPSASSVIERYKETDLLIFPCKRVTVFGSELAPSGAVHTPVSEICL